MSIAYEAVEQRAKGSLSDWLDLATMDDVGIKIAPSIGSLQLLSTV